MGVLPVVWVLATVIVAVITVLVCLAVVGALFSLVTAALGWNKRRTEVVGGPRELR